MKQEELFKKILVLMIHFNNKQLHQILLHNI